MFWEKESFYVALLAAIVPLLNHFLGWDLEAGTLGLIIIPLIALIAGDKWESAKIAEAEARVSIAAIQAGVYDIEE